MIKPVSILMNHRRCTLIATAASGFLLLWIGLHAGCNQAGVRQDQHPDVLGFDRAMRDEIHQLFSRSESPEEADSQLAKYVDRLLEIADRIEAEPDELGNFAVPDWSQSIFDQISDDVSSEELTTELSDLAEELELELPDWALPLLGNPESLSGQQQMLLKQGILVEALPFFHARKETGD